jgi:hypothetical protein
MQLKTKSVVALAVLASASVGWSVAGHAATFTFEIQANLNAGPGNATATITTGANSLSATITNNLVNQLSFEQDVTGVCIFFLNSVMVINPEPGTQTNTIATVASDGSFTTGTTTTSWFTDGFPSPSEVFIIDSTPGAPRDTFGLIGAPGSDGTYSSPGIYNSGRSPFLFETATFNVIDIGNLTADSVVTGVNFIFGATEPVGVTGLPGTLVTPLPAALPLFATGIGLIAIAGWRRKRKAQAVA